MRFPNQPLAMENQARVCDPCPELPGNRDHLTPGQVSLCSSAPETFQMPGYKAIVTAGYPQSVYDQVKQTGWPGQAVKAVDVYRREFSHGTFAFPFPSLALKWCGTTTPPPP